MTGTIAGISSSDLENLMSTLEIDFLNLAECIVSPGWRLALNGADVPAIHYNISGYGRLVLDTLPPIDLAPHTLVILPPRHAFRIEATGGQADGSALQTVESRMRTFAPGAVRRFVVGEGEPRIMMICGYYSASYGASIDLFSGLTSPIVEQFDVADGLEQTLKSALAELLAQEVGMGAMTKALLKQVLVMLLRRSLRSVDLWAERFSILSDPHIARAFADMVSEPGAPHTIHSLARSACLSRSAFMARFTALFGRAPMATLRELRMRRASALLMSSNLPIQQISRSAGYASHSSFIRAFRKAWGSDPSDYRAVKSAPSPQPPDIVPEPQ
jgi:AraC family transcriptional activator of mtrCDE